MAGLCMVAAAWFIAAVLGRRTIGGKLRLLPGSCVEGMNGLSSLFTLIQVSRSDERCAMRFSIASLIFFSFASLCSR